jgi:uncharacterized membrane protein
MAEEKGIQEAKLFAAISYIGFLCVASLVLKKDNKFVLFHAKQGLVLFVFEVASFILSIIPLLGWLMRVFWAIFLVASVWGFLEALMGNCKRLPVISGFADKIIL